MLPNRWFTLVSIPLFFALSPVACWATPETQFKTIEKNNEEEKAFRLTPEQLELLALSQAEGPQSAYRNSLFLPAEAQAITTATDLIPELTHLITGYLEDSFYKRIVFLRLDEESNEDKNQLHSRRENREFVYFYILQSSGNLVGGKLDLKSKEWSTVPLPTGLPPLAHLYLEPEPTPLLVAMTANDLKISWHIQDGSELKVEQWTLSQEEVNQDLLLAEETHQTTKTLLKKTLKTPPEELIHARYLGNYLTAAGSFFIFITESQKIAYFLYQTKKSWFDFGKKNLQIKFLNPEISYDTASLHEGEILARRSNHQLEVLRLYTQSHEVSVFPFLFKTQTTHTLEAVSFVDHSPPLPLPQVHYWLYLRREPFLLSLTGKLEHLQLVPEGQQPKQIHRKVITEASDMMTALEYQQQVLFVGQNGRSYYFHSSQNLQEPSGTPFLQLPSSLSWDTTQ